MQNAHGRAAVGIALGAALALATVTPASAQLGGLKKKLKSAAAPEAPAEAADDAAPAGGGGGGTIVLTPDVLDRLVAGLRAGEAEREAAAKEDSPYGRHHRALAAYQTAKAKCEAGQQTFTNRMVADEKLMNRYSAMTEKMVEAQGRGDHKLAMVYNDSAMAMQDPGCVVKEPQRPDDYYEQQRKVDERAEQQVMKQSDFSRTELAQVRERVDQVLRGGTPPGDLSASEKSAVASRSSELKPLLGIVPPPSAAKPAPAPAPAQPAATVPAGANAMSACVGQNSKKNEKEIAALAERAQAAQQAGDMEKLMAIADTLQRLQMGGCAAPSSEDDSEDE